MATIATSAPPGAEVLYRALSPKHDLIRLGRGDLKFSYLPEDREELFRRLESPGRKVYFVPSLDLAGEAGVRE